MQVSPASDVAGHVSSRVVSGDVRLVAEPTLVTMDLPGPEVPVIVTPVQLPRTTLEALLGGIEPEEKVPLDPMNDPARDARAATGVKARLARFLPQIAMTWPVAPVPVPWFAGVAVGQVLPGAGGRYRRSRRRGRKEYAAIVRPGGSDAALLTLLGLSNWFELLTVTDHVPVMSCEPGTTLAVTWKAALDLWPAMSSAVVGGLR